MNFLLHRHLAAAALGTPTAGLGAMLPDVWRMADRRARPSRDVAATQDERVAALLAGIDHHLDADRRFHATEAFTRGERAVAEAVDRAAPSAPRVRLFAHVLWELC
ncbi:MAG TPA: hypothetical protein VHB21_23575, partial [Minicystis sp.]|nr:hypothetical protein [Minicystis sp.]